MTLCFANAVVFRLNKPRAEKRRCFVPIIAETNGGIVISIRLIGKQFMNTRVPIARSLLWHMAIRRESIAAINALLRIDLEVDAVSKDQFTREKMYLVTMQLAKNLLKQKVITAAQYDEIDTIFTQKYEPSLSTLFTGSDLQ